MQSKAAEIVVLLATGGTIAGTASRGDDDIGYVAAQLSAAQLVAAVPALGEAPIELAQVAQIDSKDLGFALWASLAEAIERQLARPEVCGIVITHGTDTLEETAYFLQRVLAPGKPVVLVGAMRPATSTNADGPQNLTDAVTLARVSGACGVVVVMAGEVHSGLDVRKTNTLRPAAFSSGDAGATARVDGDSVTILRDWPRGDALGRHWLPADIERWPQVEIVTSHAGARRSVVDAVVAARARGIVVACTGNGTLHQALESGLIDAQTAGIAVLRSSRCGNGSVLDAAPPLFPSAGSLTPVQARIELMLRLMSAV